ncbi:fimbrillin family protein [Prevotella sp. 10(H)]|uniref:fimbrillin family protein n=1 Tax=Prevotella sp. 10(H) TaxID=1158294 RepID=UPI0004A71630|nr:fimbrillin family protein [Prevotella sp. 10(H)]
MIIRNKNFAKNLSGVLLLAAAMVGCSNSDELYESGSTDNEILLTSKVSFAKSTYDTMLHDGNKVGFYVTEWTNASTPGDPTATNLYSNVLLTSDGKGNFEYDTKMYYPLSGNKVDFYAYHPYQSTKPADITDIPFSIVEDQTSLTDYLASDLLWTKKDEVSKSNKKVPIEFKHKLTKLEFTIKKGNGTDLQNLSSVEVLNVLPETSLNLTNGSIARATGTPVNVTALGIKGTTENELTGGEAIIVPQAITGGSKLLQISVGDVKFSYAPKDATTFESGKKYNYIITINMGGIEVTSTISNWADGGSTSGEGNMD